MGVEEEYGRAKKVIWIAIKIERSKNNIIGEKEEKKEKEDEEVKEDVRIRIKIRRW